MSAEGEMQGGNPIEPKHARVPTATCGFIECGQRPNTAAPERMLPCKGGCGRSAVANREGMSRTDVKIDGRRRRNQSQNGKNGDHERSGRRLCGRLAFGTLKMAPSFVTFRVFGATWSISGAFWVPSQNRTFGAKLL